MPDRHVDRATLLHGGPCTGECVAFCISGSTRTFWEPRVMTSLRDVLLLRFGPRHRNDLYVVMNDEDTCTRLHRCSNGARSHGLSANSSARLPELLAQIEPVARRESW